jgi:hypothetical protein
MNYRRAKTFPKRQPLNPRGLADALTHLQAEGGGAWDLALVSALDIDPLTQAMFAGDPQALRIVKLITNALVNQSYVSCFCMLCEHRFTAEDKPPAFIVISSGRAGPESGALLTPLCAECYWREDLRIQVVEFWKRLVPDARAISPGPELRQ